MGTAQALSAMNPGATGVIVYVEINSSLMSCFSCFEHLRYNLAAENKKSCFNLLPAVRYKADVGLR